MDESYQEDPWLLDDASQPKRFALAGKRRIQSQGLGMSKVSLTGFIPMEKESQEQMDKLRLEIINRIQSLKGEYVDTDQWDNSITHVIAKLEPDKEGLPEKVMGAIAAGRLVLTKVIIMTCFLYLYHIMMIFNSRGTWRKALKPEIFCQQSSHI